MKLLILLATLSGVAFSQIGPPSGGGGSGSGTVGNCATNGGIAVYTVAGTVIGCMASLTTDANGNVSATSITLGGASDGAVALNGVTSGSVWFAAADIAGTKIAYILPSTNGTAGQVLVDQGAGSCGTLPIINGVIPPTNCHILAWASNIAGNAGTSTALAATPTLCTAGNAPTGILANGNATGCSSIDTGGSTAVGNSSAVTVSANSTAAQVLQQLTIPAGVLNVAAASGGVFTYNGSGIYTAAALQTPTLTWTLNHCTVSGCGSGTVRALATIVTPSVVTASNNTWNIRLAIVNTATGATGTLITHGSATVELTAASDLGTVSSDSNTTSTGTIDLTGVTYLQLTVTTSTGNAGNSITEDHSSLEPASAQGPPGPTGPAGGITVTTSGAGYWCPVISCAPNKIGASPVFASRVMKYQQFVLPAGTWGYRKLAAFVAVIDSTSTGSCGGAACGFMAALYDSTCTLIAGTTVNTNTLLGTAQKILMSFGTPGTTAGGVYTFGYTSDSTTVTFYGSNDTSLIIAELNQEGAGKLRYFTGSNAATGNNIGLTPPATCGTQTAIGDGSSPEYFQVLP